MCALLLTLNIFSNSIACCTPNSPVGLGPEYIKIPKSIKAKIFGTKRVSPKGETILCMVQYMSIESAAIFTLRGEVWFAALFR